MLTHTSVYTASASATAARGSVVSTALPVGSASSNSAGEATLTSTPLRAPSKARDRATLFPSPT